MPSDYFGSFTARGFILTTILVQVETKYCWYKHNGETKYFYCSSYERCCGGGCCENLSAFYRLWYFWICVIIFFLTCSGAGYWYKRRTIRQRVIVRHRDVGSSSHGGLAIVTLTNPRSRSTTFSSGSYSSSTDYDLAYHPIFTTSSYREVYRSSDRGQLPPDYHSSNACHDTRHSTNVSVRGLFAQGDAAYSPPPSYESVCGDRERARGDGGGGGERRGGLVDHTDIGPALTSANRPTNTTRPSFSAAVGSQPTDTSTRPPRRNDRYSFEEEYRAQITDC